MASSAVANQEETFEEQEETRELITAAQQTSPQNL